MARDTFTHTQELVAVTCTCGIAYAIPEALHTQLLDHRASDPGETRSVYCPLGHAWHYLGKSEAMLEREKRERAEAARIHAQDQLRAEQRAHSATKGKLTKTRRRIAHGVCPCCNRTFANVTRHMERQHPEYDPTAKR